MKRILSSFQIHARSKEKGQALLITLVFLAVASLILAPLLALMATGARAQTTYMDKSRELYAADAGIDYGVWKIKDNSATAPSDDPYTLPAVNDLQPDVWIELLGTVYPSPDIPEVFYNYYKVTSTASGTTVEATIRYRSGPSFFDKAVTAMGNIDLGNNTEIEGDVLAGGEITNEENITGDVIEQGDPDIFALLDANAVAQMAYNKTYVPGAATEGEEPTENPIKHGVTFNGPVVVDGDLGIQADNVTFNGPVVVDGDLDIKADNVTFNGPVVVEGNLDIGTADIVVTFESTLYVGGNLSTGSKYATIKVYDTVYIGGDLTLGGGAQFVGQQLVVVMGDIYVTGGGEVLGGAEMPFLLTPTGNFHASGGGYIYAGVYAQQAVIEENDLTGGADINGILICAELNMQGGSTITYGGDALQENEALMEMLGFDETGILQYKVIS
jgi:cytoskeletal protein CcmA (bactofilin family)